MVKCSLFLKISLFFFCFFLFLFLFTNNSFAWTEYSCEGGCGGNLLCWDCWIVCDEYNDEGFCIRSHTECTPPRVCQDCQNWELCSLSGCYCAGNCLAIPTNPFPLNGQQNITLPVTLLWSPVSGASSYRYKIDGIEGVVNTTSVTIKDCRLKSNTNYRWQVQACCDAAGNNCGSWSDWTFKTIPAPELLTPINNTTSVPIPVTLDWCTVDEAKAYSLRVYRNSQEEVFSPIPVSKKDSSLESRYVDTLDFLTKDTNYQWEVATCLREDGSDCKEPGFLFSQRWNFTTMGALSTTRLTSPPNDPTGDNPVGLPLTLDWQGVARSMSYYYELNPAISGENFTTVSEVTLDWNQLSLDTLYKWKVKSCWDYEGGNCERNWSEEWSFKTTGAPPTFNQEDSGPANGATNVLIPARLNWDDMPGATSYYCQISNNSGFSPILATSTVRDSEITFDYPLLKMVTQYWWRVKTCADREGQVCGEPSTKSFTTFRLSPPSNPSPADGGSILLKNPIGWGAVPGARFYQYKIDYLSCPPEEKKEICPSLVGQEVVQPTMTQSFSVYPPLECLGEYRWTVRACLDENCQEASDWSPLWRFTLGQPTPSAAGGIVPCGRSYDDPKTPYDEKESCQFHHVFLMLENILDFLLWHLGLIILVLLIVATGVIYYFSMGAPATMVRVKSLLKSAIIGYLIIFLAWLIIVFILGILGFQVETFGRWWQITF